VLLTVYTSLDEIDKDGVCTTGVSELARKDPWQFTGMCSSPSISACQTACAANDIWKKLTEACTPGSLDMKQKSLKPVLKGK
jgi:hypothetical protein